MFRDNIYESSKTPDDFFSVRGKQSYIIMGLVGLLAIISILINQGPLWPMAHVLYSCVNFRTLPLVTVNANIEHDDSLFVGDHVILGNHQEITIEFPVSQSDLAKQISIAITGLVSRLNPSEGYSPIDISINNHIFVTNFTMPDAGYNGQTATFTIPSDFLIVGKNTVTIQIAPTARSYFWLYNVAVGNGTLANDQCKETNIAAVVQRAIRADSSSLAEHFLLSIHQVFSSLKVFLGFTNYTRKIDIIHQINIYPLTGHKGSVFINHNGGGYH